MTSLQWRSPPACAAIFLALTALLLAPHSARAQAPADSLRLQVQRLAALVDSLSREVERLSSAGRPEEATDALAGLRAAAAAAATAGGAPEPSAEQPQAFVGRQRALQSLNPEISLNADMFAHLNTDQADRDNFIPREFEISIQSALDPYSRASVTIAQEVPGGEIVPFASGEEEELGGGFGVEEGYVEWVSLPGGVGLKLGKFFQRFGTLNRWHSHALPFQSRSLPHLALLGEESLAQPGVSLSWLAPFGGGGSGTYEATVEVTRSQNESLYGDAASPTVLAHVNAFWTLSRSTDFDLALSWIGGNYEDAIESFSRNAYTAEMSFNWRPPARSTQAGLVVRGGYILLDGLNAPAVTPPPGSEARETASGFWSMAEMRLSPNWLIGARFDRTQNPLDPNVTQWLTSPTLTWWQSEFVRIRAEYDFLSGLEGGDGSGRLLLQTTFAMGPHKHTTY